MPDPLLSVGTRTTPQSEPIPGSRQVRNNQGGYVFQVDDWTRLRRWLVLGSEGGSFYVGERELTLDNVTVLQRCLVADGTHVVDLVVEMSEAGDAPKQGPLLFAHAAAASLGNKETRSRALTTLHRVARTGTMLYQWNGYAETMRGWGRGRRAAVASWYLRPVPQVAYQAVKYRQRDGWTHRDLLRLAHPKTEKPYFDPDTEQMVDPDPGRRSLFEFIVKSGAGVRMEPSTVGIPIVDAYLELSRRELEVATPGKLGKAAAVRAVELIREVGLPWEALPDTYLSSPAVWDALLDGIGLTALLRNLPRLTKLGLVKQTGRLDPRLNRLADEDDLRKARVHPVAVLNALMTYASGRSVQGSGTWAPVGKLVDLLDDAYHASFKTVVPAGKRTLLAVDVSGSMTWTEQYDPRTGKIVRALPQLPGLVPRQAAAAMAMATIRTEPDTVTTAFSTGLTPVPITARQRLDDVIRAFDMWPSGTDCSLPMLWAAENRVEVDTFVVITDNETRHGSIHPTQALRRYREQTGIPARLAVIAMVPTEFTIADPDDPGQLDFVGFDASTPKVLADFSRGDI